MTLREALDRARPIVRRVAGPDTEDALQEAVCRALEAGVDPAQPAYLVAVARNWIVDRYRRDACAAAGRDLLPRPRRPAPPDLLVDDPLAGLTRNQRQALLLVAQGYSCREAAAVAGVSSLTVATRVFRARAALRA